MPQSFDITFQLNERVTFSSDSSVPEDLQGQTFQVVQTSTLILNDFYFNNEVFTCYTFADDDQNILFITPFRFEDDEQDKLRVTRPLRPNEISALFPKVEPSSIFNVTANTDEAQTITFEGDSIPETLQNWLGHSYYIDFKDRGPATASYVNHDPKNKKNLNPEILLAKHAYQQYTLFQGDYALYFLEANFNTPHSLLATLFLEENSLERNPMT